MASSYSLTQLAADVDFANNDCQVTLTTVSPSSSSGVEFTASQQTLVESFSVEVNGREAIIDQRFYIKQYGLSTVPSKGWVLSTGGKDYKVWDTSVDAVGVLLTLTCISRYGESI